MTAVLMSNVEVAPGTRVEFGDGIVFTDVPSWIREDRWLQKLGDRQRAQIQDSKHAFISEYESDGLGEADPRWKGHSQKGKQELTVDMNSSDWRI